MSEEIDSHVLRKYEVGQRVGKGVSKKATKLPLALGFFYFFLFHLFIYFFSIKFSPFFLCIFCLFGWHLVCSSGTDTRVGSVWSCVPFCSRCQHSICLFCRCLLVTPLFLFLLLLLLFFSHFLFLFPLSQRPTELYGRPSIVEHERL